MIEWFFFIPWGLWIVEAVSSFINGANYLRWSRGQDRAWAAGMESENQRPVALVVAIKGFDARNTPPFFEALKAQRYRRYRLILTMESPDDPVGPWVREQLGMEESETRWMSGSEQGLTEIRLVYAGPCEGRGQKVHNQLAAFALLEEGDAIVAFADADIHCGLDWLAKLTAPINAGTHPVATTYRYFVPNRPTFINHLATVINGSVATLGGREKWNSLWGGSMAIARTDFDDIDVPTLFAGSLNDDLRMGRACRRSGRRLAFVKSLLMPSPVDFTWGSFFEFGRRQYVQVRFFAPVFYKVSHLLTWTYLIGFTTAVIAILGWNSPFAWATLAIVFLCDQGRALARRRIVRHLFDAEMADKIRGAFWVEHFLTPFWMLIHATLTTSVLFKREIRWAGIGYRILAPDRTEVLGKKK